MTTHGAHMTTYLSPHFSLEELTISEWAVRHGIDNRPPKAARWNLSRIANKLEEIRQALGGYPIIVTSGYRAAALNQALGGAANSQHLLGEAADFHCPRYGPPESICRRLLSVGVGFDQLIHEGTWVHVSIADQPRGEVLTAIFNPGATTTYRQGIDDPPAFPHLKAKD